MTKDITVRRRPDGSIDTEHFLRKGWFERSSEVKHAISKTMAHSRGLTATLVGLLVVFWQHTGQA